MRILALQADRFGCGHYRISLPAAHAGVPVTVEDRLPLQTRRLPGGGRVLYGVPVDADVVVIQRPMSHHLPAVIEILQQQGVAVVVEIDDDLTALNPKHAAYEDMHPRGTPHSNWQHLRTCCRAADLVTVTTPALARRFAAHGRVAVIPNYVPEALLEVRTAWDTDFGWTGTIQSHPGDLPVLGLTVKKLVDEGYSFRVIGPGAGVARALWLDTVDDTGWLDLAFYYRAAAQLRVGIVPLADSAFNHAKSSLKGVEYAALGIPFVATPTPAYEELYDRGIGLLARKPSHWLRNLRLLLDHAAAREDLAAAGRNAVQQHYTIEAQGWRWAEAWERAIQYRKSRSR